MTDERKHENRPDDRAEDAAWSAMALKTLFPEGEAEGEVDYSLADAKKVPVD